MPSTKETKDFYIGNAIYMKREDLLNKNLANNFAFATPTFKTSKSFTINFEITKKNLYLDDQNQWDNLIRESSIKSEGTLDSTLDPKKSPTFTINDGSGVRYNDNYWLKIIVYNRNQMSNPIFYQLYNFDSSIEKWIFDSNSIGSDETKLSVYGITLNHTDDGIKEFYITSSNDIYSVIYKIIEEK